MRQLIGLGTLCAVLGCGGATDFSAEERAALLALSNPPAPPVDRSNEWSTDQDAQRLGQRLFFDKQFAGPPSLVDALDRSVSHARPADAADGLMRLSCAGCHALGSGGSDHDSVPNNVSVGAGWTPANALGVVNAAYYDLMFWNGRADSLWGMIIPVLESKVSMNGNRLALAWRMQEVYGAEYTAIFKKELPFVEPWELSKTRLLPTADGGFDPVRCMRGFDGSCPAPSCYVRDGECVLRFPRSGRPSDVKDCDLRPDHKPDPWACLLKADAAEITLVAVNFAKAIAAYEMLLTSTDSLFDRHMRGVANMSPAAVRGARLFVGKAACAECHSGPMLTDQGFHNLGVPQRGMGAPLESDCPAANKFCDCVTPAKCQPWGRFDGLQALVSSKYLRTSTYSSDNTDATRKSYYDEPSSDAQKGAWRTPSLRNVALTAPYMHNGAFATLEEVIEHYNRGGTVSGAASSERSPKLVPLLLDTEEKADLVAFLEALSGDPLPAELTRAPP